MVERVGMRRSQQMQLALCSSVNSHSLDQTSTHNAANRKDYRRQYRSIDQTAVGQCLDNPDHKGELTPRVYNVSPKNQAFVLPSTQGALG